MNINLSSIRKRNLLLIVVMWLVIEIVLYIKFGAHFELEAKKYINASNYLLKTGELPEARFVFYFSTIAIISFSFALGTGEYGALAILMSINLLAYLYFFKALKFLFKENFGPFCVIALLLTFWPYQSWTLYLYTECLFYSSVLLLFSRLILFRSLDLHFFVTTSCLLLLLITSRPLGVLFVPPVLLFVFFKLSKGQRFVFFGIGVLSLFLLLNYVVQIVFTTTSDWNIQKTMTQGDIICDVPGAVDSSKLELINHPNQLYKLYFYVTHNFSHFLKLALTRLKFFFTMVRVYYSPIHNFYLALYMALIYSVILLGWRKIFKTLDVSLVWFILSLFLLFAMAIALQCDDWHNRFFLTLMPFLFTLFVVALRIVSRRFSFIRRLI